MEDSLRILPQWDVVCTQVMRDYRLVAYRLKSRGLSIKFFSTSSSPENSSSWDFAWKKNLTGEQHGSTQNLQPDSPPNTHATFCFWPNLPSKKYFSKVPTLESGSGSQNSKICTDSLFYVKNFGIVKINRLREWLQSCASETNDVKFGSGRQW